MPQGRGKMKSGPPRKAGPTGGCSGERFASLFELKAEAALGLAKLYTRAMMAKSENTKKLFLVDAMAHIYRAFYAPMVRMNAPSGIPTKVPFLFANIVRRLLKDYKPEYVAIVFDTRQPTFRDKLFEAYKAQRPPMPDEMSVQLPYVRRLCEAMRLPILELDGFEADDVIGTMAKKASAKKDRCAGDFERQGHDATGESRRADSAYRFGRGQSGHDCG